MVSFRREDGEREVESSEEAEERRLAEIRRALTETEGKGVGEQAEAVAEAMLAQPSQPTTDWMWRTLVIGLFALLFLVLAGVIAGLFLDKSTEALSTIFGIIFGGLIGVFVPGPNDRVA